MTGHRITKRMTAIEEMMESGLIATGASIWVQGTLVGSQGSKQKVELKVDKVVVDFFGKLAFLTVSGQFNGCILLLVLILIQNGEVYTFGSTIRAENSNTSRHLAEFWMIEPELAFAFANLNDDMACATAYLHYVVRHVLDNCKEDMEFFNTWIEDQDNIGVNGKMITGDQLAIGKEIGRKLGMGRSLKLWERMSSLIMETICTQLFLKLFETLSRLVLTFSVLTTTKRVFFAIKLVKTRLRNKMKDD
ncbi:hypothetical protein CRYUN_Cryun13aG0041400 [Craigia yunnanensis]